MIASLMMYRRPELDPALDTFWVLIRQHLTRAGIDAPETLSQAAEEFSVWKHPDLVLSQTCGMPYRLWLKDQVQLVGTPDFGLPDCPPGYYRSALIVRKTDSRSHLADFRTARFAYNQDFSQSGYAAPYWHVMQEGFWFENRLQTGAHLASARAVATGVADIAAIDAVTWGFATKFESFTDDLHVLDWTAPTPGLPLITGAKQVPSVILAAVKQALADLPQREKDLLAMRDIVSVAKDDYLAIRNPPER